MMSAALDARSQHGLDLVRAKHELFQRIDQNRWIVPSATCPLHAYLVDISHSTCTCPDAEAGATYKHLWAVRYLRDEITLLDGTQLMPPPHR